MRFPLARIGGRGVPDLGHAFGVKSMTLPLVPPLLRLLALTLPLAIAFGMFALSFRGPAFFTAIPLPIPMGLGGPCKRASGLDLRVYLRGRANAEVAGVVREKQVLLFKEMLQEIGNDDLDVVNLLVTGVKIVGDLPRVGIWKPRPNPASVSLPALLSNAQSAQATASKPIPSATKWHLQETLNNQIRNRRL